MSTALELVNRMRAKRRTSTQAIITDREGVAYLEILNGAINTVLEEKSWRFQVRSDGVLKTIPPFTGTTTNIVAGATAVAANTHTGTTADIAGDFLTRIMFNEDTQYASTSFALTSALVAIGNVLGTLNTAWPGATYAGAWETFVYEYQLPATVRQVLSVVHQETPVQLAFEDETYTFDAFCPRPQDYRSTEPEVVMVGGEVANTADQSAGDSSVYAMAFKVYPVPDAEQLFNYSYVYRQPRLTLLTDELSRVPPAVESLIVDLAVARVIAFLEKDLQIGLPLEAKVMKQVDLLHRNHGADPARRTAMKSFDEIGRAAPLFGRLPRTVEGL